MEAPKDDYWATLEVALDAELDRAGADWAPVNDRCDGCDVSIWRALGDDPLCDACQETADSSDWDRADFDTDQTGVPAMIQEWRDEFDRDSRARMFARGV